MKKKKIAGIDFSRKYICMECGCQRDPVVANRGMFIFEVFLWGVFLMAGAIYGNRASGGFLASLALWGVFMLPGAVYSIWRRVRTQLVCPQCRTPSMELTNSTRVMQMMRIMKTFSASAGVNPNPEVTPSPVPSKPPSPKAPSGSKTEKKDVKQILKASSRKGLKSKGQQGLIDFRSPGEDQ